MNKPVIQDWVDRAEEKGLPGQEFWDATIKVADENREEIAAQLAEALPAHIEKVKAEHEGIERKKRRGRCVLSMDLKCSGYGLKVRLRYYWQVSPICRIILPSFNIPFADNTSPFILL